MSMEEFLDYAHQEAISLFPFLDIPWGAYFELTRLSQPAEALMAVLLYSVGLMFSASLVIPPLQPKDVLPLACRGALWVYYMRHAICTFKAAVDYEYDRHVRRRQSGPVARGALTPDEAFNFSSILLLLGTLGLFYLPRESHGLGVIVTLVMMLYPFGKRFTSYPQLIMGFGFTMGVFMSGNVIGVDLSPGSGNFRSALYLGIVLMLLATIANVVYTYQDMRDDAKVGGKSMALIMSNRPKTWLFAMTAITGILLWKIGNLSDYSILFNIISCGGSFFALSTMLALIDLRVARDCEWWFRRGMMGSVFLIFGGLYMEYVIRLYVLQ
ncbi:prenyltransferase [Talaromyces pinophilus]|uniref:Prenyltransferase n=1 Tax=Talaromyces pinophilus TaxID=128442 RepID=A0A6V8HAX0_TALPI|nr:prenyltransferase [Talaromyces pinophilus]